MNDVISEFFYDGICRVIPGLVVISLYWPKLAVKAMKVDTAAAATLAVFCILCAAWLIGITVETISFDLVKELWQARSDNIAPQLCREERKEERERRRRWYKSSSESRLFRQMMVISFVSIFPGIYFHPEKLAPYACFDPLVDLCNLLGPYAAKFTSVGWHWHWCHALVCFIIFALAWRVGHKKADDEERIIRDAAKNEQFITFSI